ncbi:MAG TPA: ABC transporter permease, partial [Bryobacteraceae bacterium]|nr:ABC transporter permease [Bryobacteraceae bacterium]
MFLTELIWQGWQALVRNRLRSALTMLGIVWGLASVVILLAYGQGLGGSVLHAFLNMGNNVIVFWPGQTSMQAGGQRAGKKITYEYADVLAIREEVPIIRAVSAESDSSFGYKVATRVVSIQTRGVELPYGQMRKLDIDQGRYFNQTDFTEHHRVAILGSEAAHRVFQGAPAVGQTVNIHGLDFDVIGVMRNKIQDSMYEGPDNEDGFIPFELFRDLKNEKDPDMIIIQPTAPELN